MAKEIVLPIEIGPSQISKENVVEENLILKALTQSLNLELDELKVDKENFWSKVEKKKLSDKNEIDLLKSFFDKSELILPESNKPLPTIQTAPIIQASFKVEFDELIFKIRYNDFMLDVEELKKKTFYILPSIDLDTSLTWEDLGVGQQENFSGVILDAWKKLAQSQFTGFDQVVVLDKDFVRKPDALNPNSVTLKWKSIYKKMSSNSEAKTMSFELNAQYILVKTKTNEVISSFDFPSQKREFSTDNKKNLSSNLASLVYNLLLAQSGKISKVLLTESLIVSRCELESKITSKTSLSEIYQLISALQENLKDIKLAAQMKSFSEEGTTIVIRAESTLEKLLATLAKNDGQMPLTEKKILVFNSSDKTFAIITKQKNN